VEIRQLKSRSELNGRSGNVVRYDRAAGRFGVRIDGQTLAVKPENLLLNNGATADGDGDDLDEDDDPEAVAATTATTPDDDDDNEWKPSPPWAPPPCAEAPLPMPEPRRISADSAAASEPPEGSADRDFDGSRFTTAIKMHEAIEKYETMRRVQENQRKWCEEKLDPLINSLPTEEELKQMLHDDMELKYLMLKMDEQERQEEADRQLDEELFGGEGEGGGKGGGGASASAPPPDEACLVGSDGPGRVPGVV
jgi:hypothetical protein